MTFFHYYTYYKSLREIDRVELSIGCVYLACKIQYIFIPMEEVGNIYRKIKNSPKEHLPDFIKLEIEILNFLGFELNVETPYEHLYMLLEKYNQSLLKNERLINFAYNIINDTYRRPICIFYHPKIISLAALYITAKYFEIELSFEQIRCYERSIKQEDLFSCINSIVNIIDGKIQ
jgi:hypothetical protein